MLPISASASARASPAPAIHTPLPPLSGASSVDNLLTISQKPKNIGKDVDGDRSDSGIDERSADFEDDNDDDNNIPSIIISKAAAASAADLVAAAAARVPVADGVTTINTDLTNISSVTQASPLSNLADTIATASGAAAATTTSANTPVSEQLLPSRNAHWERTLGNCIRAIVSIRLCTVRSFDTEQAGSAVASGFIVDAAKGIILTNRHVVNPGPMVAEAILQDHEEVTVKPIYRDPVHDFGFLQFDTSKVRFMNIVEIPLRPEKARIGIEIRVVGNDAGEKLSILAGTLARLDRKAPDYGQGKYTDFNTFYFQAASSTSGGSSGSPVLDIEGNAVALNAGGRNKTATSYYLPLDRVDRALRLIQSGQCVTRGTLQTIFKHMAYDEVRRLGLLASIEQSVRTQLPGESGMLVVDQILPKGPADGLLQPGDILLTINGNLVTQFVALESILDTSVDQQIVVTVERGAEELKFELQVQNLHSITPNHFVEYGGAVFNELGYILARSYCLPVGGVFVAQAGYWLSLAQLSRSGIIVAVDNKRVSSIKELVKVLESLADGARVPIRWFSLRDLHRERVCIATVERHWHAARIAYRNDETGLWDYTDFPPPPPSPPLQPPKYGAKFVSLRSGSSTANDGLDEVVSSLVSVEFSTPYMIDGVTLKQYAGFGLVLDAASGLVLCDRNSVPTSLGDINLTFANTLIVPGRLVYLHPIFNVAFIRYDPKYIGDTQVQSAKLATKMLQQGDSVNLVVLTKSQQPVLRKTTVVNIRVFFVRECSPPRFRSMNVDGIELDNPTAACIGGVLADDTGNVQGLWISHSCQDSDGRDTEFFMGLSMEKLLPVIEKLKKGESPVVRSLEVELHQVHLAQGRSLGLSDEWVRRIEDSSEHRRTLLAVRRLTANTESAAMLREGDLLLAIQGNVVTGFSDFNVATDQEILQVDILREGKEIQLNIPTTELDGHGTNRVVNWSGVTLQEPHRAVSQQISSMPCKIFCSWWSNGSPAHMYGLRSTVFILEVNGTTVKTLDDFLAAVLECHDNSYVRIKTIDFAKHTKVFTVKVNQHYFPTWELRADPEQKSGWNLRQYPRIPQSPSPSPTSTSF